MVIAKKRRKVYKSKGIFTQFNEWAKKIHIEDSELYR